MSVIDGLLVTGNNNYRKVIGLEYLDSILKETYCFSK